MIAKRPLDLYGARQNEASPQTFPSQSLIPVISLRPPPRYI